MLGLLESRKTPYSGSKHLCEENYTLFFFHIGKTAGTTFTDMLFRQYRKDQILQIRLREYGKGISFKEYARLPYHVKQKIRLITGHMPFGLHEFNPIPSAYLTFFRDPLKRAISEYNHVTTKPDHPAHERYLVAFPTIDRFLTKYPTEGKGYMKWILEHHSSSLPIQLDDHSFDRVKKILDNHFICIGLTEKFDESIILMKNLFNWDIPFYNSRNLGSYRRESLSPSDEAVEVFKRQNKQEYMLYDYAVERFNRQFDAFGEELKTQVDIFRILNSQY